jgi:hypothetical protein
VEASASLARAGPAGNSEVTARHGWGQMELLGSPPRGSPGLPA